MSIQKIGVVGAGQMGNGIAHVAAACGLDVIMHDVKQEFVDRGLENDRQEPAARRRQGPHDRRRQSRPSSRGSLRDDEAWTILPACDFVVEAVVENIDVKAEIFSKLDTICRAGVILASNTSSISITKIAACTERPERVIGMHFMNPVPVMKLVEVIRGLQPPTKRRREVLALAESLGKTAVECRDFPGFVSNRVLLPMINEAIYCLHEGVAEPEAIDTIMKLGMNHPMGPLTLADFIGLDTCLGDPRGAARGARRSEVPAVPVAAQTRRGRLARPQERARFLRLLQVTLDER